MNKKTKNCHYCGFRSYGRFDGGRFVWLYEA